MDGKDLLGDDAPGELGIELMEAAEVRWLAQGGGCLGGGADAEKRDTQSVAEDGRSEARDTFCVSREGPDRLASR